MPVVVIGSLNMDICISTDRMPKIGETMNGKDFFNSCGGKGANQAVSVANQNCDTTLIGAIGDDDFGKHLIKKLNAHNVNTDYIKVSKDNTGTAVIVLVDSDNFIVINNGANYDLSPDDIKNLEDVIKKHDIMVLQLETRLETVTEAIKIGHKNGLKIVLNPAPCVKLEKELLSLVDYVVLNETEMQLILDKELETDQDYKNSVTELKKLGVKNPILTLGEKGVMFLEDDVVVLKPAKKVHAVDTTSAGDAFIGGFVSRLSEGYDVSSAIDFAIAVSAITVTRKGAMDSIPLYDEVMSKINE